MSDIKHRVVRISKELKAAVAKFREEASCTWEMAIEQSVGDQLENLMADLFGAGLPGKVKGTMARLPLSESLISRLNKASAIMNIPAQTLLLACLLRQCGRGQTALVMAAKPVRKARKTKTASPKTGRRRAAAEE